MKQIKQSRREINKNKVIQCALKSFVNNGIENSKVSDIAKEAGVTERSAFRYFNSKADLVLETALLFYRYVIKHIEEDYNKNVNKDATGLEKIRFVIKEYMSLYFSSPNEIIFVNEAEVYLNRCGYTSLINNKPPSKYEDEIGPLATAIKEGIKDGSVRNDDDIPSLYYNTYDSVLGLMEKMIIDSKKDIKYDERKRLDIFCEILVNSYAKQ